MQKKYWVGWLLASGLLLGTLSYRDVLSTQGAPGLKSIHPSCGLAGCHQASPNTLRGSLISVSMRAGLIQIDTGQNLDVYFDDNTSIVNWKESLGKISRGTPVKIVYTDRDGKRYATLISVKPPMSVPPEQRISFEEVKKLWESKGALIIDVRPPAKHAEGHIPNTINIPFPKLEEQLPKVAPDKNQLIVFYCEGPR